MSRLDVRSARSRPAGGSRFLDSAEHVLNSRRYVFRKRVDVDSEEREVMDLFPGLADELDDAGAAGGNPACVEFSFKYGDDREDSRGSVTRDAHDVLQALGQLSWVHAKPTTKTALVYR